MKLIKTLHRLTTEFRAKLPISDIYLKSFLSILFLSALSVAIWMFGEYLAHKGYPMIFSTSRRFYIIATLFLLWLLKFLMIDLETPDPNQYRDPQLRKKLQTLKSRFLSTLKFIKKTSVSHANETIGLNQLPWYLLIGPVGGGKTSLLAHSNINYVLQRQFANQNILNLEKSEHCDWWITRDMTVIDVPGMFLCAKETEPKTNVNPILWRFFLRLIKKYRGIDGIKGVIIAMPLAEIMKQGDPKNYQKLLRDLLQRVYELQKIFKQTLPCYFIITKCDLLPGFKEFFAESGNDEITQAWGISLANLQSTEKMADVFSQRFDGLIKKLNQQLLWRLHQERNPMARPYIKDFPLQVERIKEFALDFIKKTIDAKFSVIFQGVYLTSAIQLPKEESATVLDEAINNNTRTLQIFKEPTLASRPYFIKQFMTHGLSINKVDVQTRKSRTWQRRIAYAFSVAVIGTVAVLLGKDFERGVNQAYSVQNYLTEYQVAVQQNQNPEEHLIQTTILLDTLQQVGKKSDFQLNAKSILSFYSHQTTQKAGAVYHEALKNILIPEVKNYLEEYLNNPINKNADSIYAVLKAYLMLGNNNYFQPDYVLSTVREIFPKNIPPLKTKSFMRHFRTVLLNWEPIQLNANTIQQTRRYLTGMPSTQLGYVILRNINGNYMGNEVNLGTNDAHSIFISRQVSNRIPKMFTIKEFSNIVSEQIAIAAKEATVGNWIIGNEFVNNKSPDLATAIFEQLRLTYLTNYINIWENILSNVQVVSSKNLHELDNMIVHLTSAESPLLQLLQTLHDNTYFEPITTSSPKLQNLGLLLDKTKQTENLLYQIFTSLQSLHQYIQTICIAENEKKAAFEAVTHRMLNADKPDAIAQLRLVAAKSPDPLKNWLNKIANDTWHFLMQDAINYLDTSWQNRVGHFYQKQIAERYPFSLHAKSEVELQKFTDFFGKPGVLLNFYQQYLQAFIDTSNTEWQWRSFENEKLPFSEESLHQIQQAMQIHQIFFPNDDNKLYLQFALQPYKFAKQIKSVKLNINNKHIKDTGVVGHNTHMIAWPNQSQLKKTSVALALSDKKIVNRDFVGEWGWFKLVGESFESAVTKKEMLINLSIAEHPAKYLLSTEAPVNPFITLSWRKLVLPKTLISEDFSENA